MFMTACRIIAEELLFGILFIKFQGHINQNVHRVSGLTWLFCGPCFFMTTPVGFDVIQALFREKKKSQRSEYRTFFRTADNLIS